MSPLQREDVWTNRSIRELDDRPDPAKRYFAHPRKGLPHENHHHPACRHGSRSDDHRRHDPRRQPGPGRGSRRQGLGCRRGLRAEQPGRRQQRRRLRPRLRRHADPRRELPHWWPRHRVRPRLPGRHRRRRLRSARLRRQRRIRHHHVLRRDVLRPPPLVHRLLRRRRTDQPQRRGQPRLRAQHRQWRQRLRLPDRQRSSRRCPTRPAGSAAQRPTPRRSRSAPTDASSW